LRYTLVTDGISDQTLVPIINWAFHDVGFSGTIESNWADLRRVPPVRRIDLRTRILTSIELYPCDLILVHRDAEREPWENRVAEIAGAVPLNPSAVPVVPVRMTEAWLLHDVTAIRQAAGNPNGTDELHLPRPETTEQIPDPKEVLYGALRDACGLNARRRARLDVTHRRRRVAELITDFTPLRRLPAFAAFQADLRSALNLIRSV
jgi:hypothetical protein